jgi:hypothetical protein
MTSFPCSSTTEAVEPEKHFVSRFSAEFHGLALAAVILALAPQQSEDQLSFVSFGAPAV